MLFLTERNIELTIVEKDSGIVTAEGTYATEAGLDPTFVQGIGDCPSSLMMVPSTDQIKLNVLVRELGSETNTRVTTKLSRRYSDSLTNSYTVMPCNSTGKLEKLILDRISALEPE